MTQRQLDLSAGHRALRGGRQSLARGIYLVTSTTLDRRPLFRDVDAANAACAAFALPAAIADARLLCWVLMPDHAHWLVELGEGEPLARVVGRLKGASARAVNRALHMGGSIWARAYHERALRCWQDVEVAAHYVINNPVRASIVASVGEYPFWGSIWSVG